MMRVCVVLTVAAVLSGSGFGQSTRTRPTFEIADVHESSRIIRNGILGRIGGKEGFRTSLRGERYEVRNATMVDLIGTAYTVDSDRVSGGPSWLEFDQFDVTALVPPNTQQATLNLMLQSLLADRFKLMVHNDTKLIPGFVLSVGKSKLKDADVSGKTGCQSQPVIERQIIMVNLSCRNITMDAFAAELKGRAGGYVLNSTGLKGSWDLDIRFTDKSQPAGSERVTLLDGINTQLGLKLQEQTVLTPVILVDGVNEKPSVNPPDTAKRLPPLPPAAFEVAVIKPTGTGGNEVGAGGIQPGGRVMISGGIIPLHSVISIAWNLDPNEELIGAPKWLDSARFDMIATLPAAFRGADAATAPIPEMLQTLLMDRFKMKIHYEDRLVAAYALVAAKPKLKKADASTRTGCKLENLSRTGQVISQPVSCQNMTMAQFASQLQSIAGPYGGPYFRYPIVDATGLDGGWDFSFAFDPLVALQAAGRGNPFSGGPAGATSDPVGGLSLVDVIDKQLGLKLEAQKRTYPVFIVDHIEERPTDN
ncbi:MAG TPA: TIGR03435 family protein [Terriglobia bacterium]|jgi:uncharacterized protein (TIGR03435 family)